MQDLTSNFDGNNSRQPKVINGRGLRHRRLTRDARARLAADWIVGTARLTPSLGQAASVLDVPEPAVRACLQANGNGHSRKKNAPVPVEQRRLSPLEDRRLVDLIDDLRCTQDVLFFAQEELQQAGYQRTLEPERGVIQRVIDLLDWVRS
jgi:hypothetical protein